MSSSWNNEGPSWFEKRSVGVRNSYFLPAPDWKHGEAISLYEQDAGIEWKKHATYGPVRKARVQIFTQFDVLRSRT